MQFKASPEKIRESVGVVEGRLRIIVSEHKESDYSVSDLLDIATLNKLHLELEEEIR